MNEDALAPLRERFVERCRGDLDLIKRLRAAMPPLPEGEEGVLFHRTVHTIAGGAGMFGFPEASEEARKVETALLADPREGGEVIRHTDRLISALENMTGAA